MKTLLKRRFAATLLAGILLFSNYGILAFADDSTQPSENPTEQVIEDVTEEQEINQKEDVTEDQETAQDEDVTQEQEISQDEDQINDEELNNELNNELEEEQVIESDEIANKGLEEEEFQTFDLGLEMKPMNIEEEVIVIYYQDNNVSSGINIPGTPLGTVVPTLFELENIQDDQIIQLIQAYCNQLTVYIQDQAQYKIELLTDSEVGKNDNLRGILLNGYPTQTLEELQKLPGLSGLTDKQAIAATQLAIWNLTREGSQKLDSDNDNVKALYNLLITKTEAISTPSSSIIVSTPEVKLVENEVKVTFSYSVDKTNPIKNTFVEDKFESDGFIEESRITENGVTTVTYKKQINLAESVIIDGQIKINGTFDFYNYYNLNHNPTDGIATSQGLIGLPFLTNYNLPGFEHLFNFRYTPKEEPPVIVPPIEQPPTSPPVIPPVRDNDDEDEVVVVEDEETPLAPPVEPQVVLASVTSIEVPQEDIVEEIVPLAVPVVNVQQEEVIVEDLPLGVPQLPKTGGFAPELLYAIGLGLIGLGYKFKK